MFEQGDWRGVAAGRGENPDHLFFLQRKEAGVGEKGGLGGPPRHKKKKKKTFK